MSLTTRVKTLLLVFAWAFVVNIVDAAAIPSSNAVGDVGEVAISPDGYNYTKSTSFKEYPSGNGDMIRIYGSPQPQSKNPTDQVKRALNKRSGWCGHSSFINRSSPASPFVNDCLAIGHLQQQIENAYTVSNTVYFQELASYRSCKFAAIAPHGRTRIGNNDIADLISDSVRRFSWDGKVGSEGFMACASRYGHTIYETQWAIFHT